MKPACLKGALLGVLLLTHCASYSIASYDSKVPLSFANERGNDEKFRHFRIERKLTWAAFDLLSAQPFEFDEVIREELPSARKIINLRIRSEEDPLDSAIRVLGTLIQYLLVTDRALFSRRTIVIDGDVLE